jgi:hypothetical protein
MTSHAVLALWRSGERRTYRKGGNETTRELALVLDYGFTGDQGHDDLMALLCEAAVEVVDQGFSHLTLFVSDEHGTKTWNWQSDRYVRHLRAYILGSQPRRRVRLSTTYFSDRRQNPDHHAEWRGLTTTCNSNGSAVNIAGLQPRVDTIGGGSNATMTRVTSTSRLPSATAIKAYVKSTRTHQ